jgi:hypothetical protein
MEATIAQALTQNTSYCVEKVAEPNQPRHSRLMEQNKNAMLAQPPCETCRSRLMDPWWRSSPEPTNSMSQMVFNLPFSARVPQPPLSSVIRYHRLIGRPGSADGLDLWRIITESRRLDRSKCEDHGVISHGHDDSESSLSSRSVRVKLACFRWTSCCFRLVSYGPMITGVYGRERKRRKKDDAWRTASGVCITAR